MIVAMLSGENAVTVYFNHFGEATIEYIMYFILAPIISYSFYYEVSKFRRAKNAKKRYAKSNIKHLGRIKEE